MTELVAQRLMVEIERLTAENLKLKREIEAMYQNSQEYGNVWYWQGDGYDNPERLVCPILIEPDDFCKLLKIDRKGNQT